MPPAQRQSNRYLSIPDFNSKMPDGLKRETKPNVRYNIYNLEYENFFIPNLKWRP